MSSTGDSEEPTKVAGVISLYMLSILIPWTTRRTHHLHIIKTSNKVSHHSGIGLIDNQTTNLVNYRRDQSQLHPRKARGNVPPECEKWQRTLQLLRRAIVISETTISRNAEKVEKTPNLSAAKPKPAAAEKLPRSMIPDGTNTSGCF